MMKRPIEISRTKLYYEVLSLIKVFILIASITNKDNVSWYDLSNTGG